MGLIKGVYEAKKEGFREGGASLHSCMTPHGPDTKTFEIESTCKLEPYKLSGTMSFMFESTFLFKLTPYSMSSTINSNYYKCWEGLKSNFDGNL